MITVVDYNMGNVKSIMNMLKKIGIKSVLSRDTADILKADRLILPGVGSFDTAMTHLKQYGLIDVLTTKVLEQKTPVLGICLGMQIMARGSEEGSLPGLGWFDANVKKFNFDIGQEDKKIPIPHMGWNNISLQAPHPLFDSLEEARFYFVHSYHVECKSNILATATYGYEFVCAIGRGNIYAVQFHPEKSHRFGMRLLQNFALSIRLEE